MREVVPFPANANKRDWRTLPVTDYTPKETIRWLEQYNPDYLKTYLGRLAIADESTTDLGVKSPIETGEEDGTK